MRNSSVYEKIYIVGQTRDPAVKSIMTMVLAVCGELFEYHGSDPDDLLYVKLTAPSQNPKVVSMLELF